MGRWKNAHKTNDEIQRLKRMTVLKEAGRAFSKYGYHNTSLDEVARALGIAKGTLYNYVRDKQEILFECHSLAQDIGDQAIAKGLREGRTGAEKLAVTLGTTSPRCSRISERAPSSWKSMRCGLRIAARSSRVATPSSRASSR